MSYMVGKGQSEEHGIVLGINLQTLLEILYCALIVSKRLE
jgi:hypothetical protein